MSKFARLMLVTACGLVLAGCSSENQSASVAKTSPTTQPAKVEVDRSPITMPGSIIHRDIPYVAHAAPLQKLDVYAPPSAHNAPVIIYIHRGEWSKGDKSEVSYKPLFLNQHGIILVSANYRLAPQDHHPAMADDVASAVGWVHSHASEFGGDPSRIALLGHSAGCHLVALVGLDPQYLAHVGMKPSDLLGVVSWSGGAFDLVEKESEGGTYTKYIHQAFGDSPSTWRDASPMNHVGDAKPMPKFLLVTAEQDKAPSQAANDRLATLIRNAGGQAKRVTLPGKSHGTADHDLGMPNDNTGQLLLSFLGL